MGNGLLAWWHRRIASHGLVGAVVGVVPVTIAALVGFGAIAALVGFGPGLSGIASGLSSIPGGPDTPVSAQTDSSTPNGAAANDSGSSVGPDSLG